MSSWMSNWNIFECATEAAQSSQNDSLLIAVKATDSKLHEQQEHTTKPIRVTALQLNEQLNPSQKSN